MQPSPVQWGHRSHLISVLVLWNQYNWRCFQFSNFVDFPIIPSGSKPNKRMMKYREFFRSLFKLIYANGNRIKLVHAN